MKRMPRNRITIERLLIAFIIPVDTNLFRLITDVSASKRVRSTYVAGVKCEWLVIVVAFAQTLAHISISVVFSRGVWMKSASVKFFVKHF